MSAETDNYQLQFKGPPSKLVAIADLSIGSSSDASIKISKNRFPLQLTTDGTTLRSLSFAMPDNTLPQRFEAEVSIGPVKRSAIVSVDPRTKVSFKPATVDVKVRAGQKAKTTLSVTNFGNKALTLACDTMVTLRENGMLGRQIAQAFKQQDRDFPDRLIVLGELVDKIPSYEASVATTMSASSLAVDECTELTIELGIPENIDTSKAWTGSLAVLGKRLRINVEPTALVR